MSEEVGGNLEEQWGFRALGRAGGSVNEKSSVIEGPLEPACPGGGKWPSGNRNPEWGTGKEDHG